MKTIKMKDSGIEWIGEIPEDWKVERFQWYLEEIKVVNAPVQTKQVLSLTNKSGVIPYEEKGAQGNVSKEDFSQYKLAYPNTIVANSMNILIGSVGICKYFGCISPVYYVFKPNSFLNLHFANYIMQTAQFQKELRKYANGIMEIRLRLSSSDILKREIPVPNVDVQEKIVDVLDVKCAEIDKLIANQQGQIDKLKEYKQSVITETVTKGLDPSVPMKDSGVEWIGSIPEEWKISSVKSLFNIISGATPKSDIQEYWDGDIIWVTPSDFKTEDVFVSQGKRNISLKGLKSCSTTMVPINSIIFSKRAPIGLVAINKNELCTNQGCLSCVNIFEQNIKYFYYVMSICTEQFNLLGSGTTFKEISATKFSLFSLPQPSVAEQQQIADYLDDKCGKIDQLIAIKQQKIDKLQQYKKSLIYEYVTGKKEVV